MSVLKINSLFLKYVAGPGDRARRGSRVQKSHIRPRSQGSHGDFRAHEILSHGQDPSRTSQEHRRTDRAYYNSAP